MHCIHNKRTFLDILCHTVMPTLQSVCHNIKYHEFSIWHELPLAPKLISSFLNQ